MHPLIQFTQINFINATLPRILNINTLESHVWLQEISIFSGESFSLMYLLFSVLICTASWSRVVFMLSLAARYLNRQGPLHNYSNEAVLPFYLLHQTVILCVGWYVIRWDLGMALKYLIIAAVSIVLIMSIYELLIRRFNVMRFLSGMRPKRGNT